jgi:hypothetical protein
VDIDPDSWLPGSRHVVLLHVLVATLIDATGLPFPGRILLIAAGASTTDPWRAVTLTAAGSLGALVGDHLWYMAGRLGDRWRAVVERIGLGRAMLIAGLLRLVGTAATVGWRLWRRRRHGPVHRGPDGSACAGPRAAPTI